MQQKKLLLLTSALLTLAAVSSSFAKELPIKRIVLSTSGLANFELEGSVSPSDQIEIPAQNSQIDDLLKSLVVLDDNGSVDSITLPGNTPLEDTFKKLPLDKQDFTSLTKLLNALQGADVVIDGPSKIAGKLISVDEEKIADEKGEKVAHYRISVLADNGILQTSLDNVSNIKLVSTELQNQLLISRDFEYIGHKAFNDLAEQTVKVEQLIYGLKRAIR